MSPQPPKAGPLADALAHQDVAAVAFALRNDVVIVPLLPGTDEPQPRVFRAPGSDRFSLLLFSSVENYRLMLPDEEPLPVAAYDRTALVELLSTYGDSLEAAWFDIAGPFPMQADPMELFDTLTR